MNIFDITNGGWALDAIAWGGVLTAAGTFWRMALAPFVRSIMRIADGVDKLNALVSGDVLDRLDEGSRLFGDHGQRLIDHEGRIVSLEEWRAEG